MARLIFYDERVDHIPLARAAALAYERLFPEQTAKDSKTLDMIALALSSVMPLYQRDTETDALRLVEESEIAAGRFTRGATTVEFAGRPPLRYLVVSRSELSAAIEKLMSDSLAATLAAVQQRRSCSSPSRMS